MPNINALPALPPATGGHQTQTLLLTEYRARLKAQLREGRFETLAEALLAVIARVATAVCFRRLRVGYWGAALLLFLATFLGTTLLVLFDLDGFPDKPFGLVMLHLWGAVIAILQLLSARYYARRICYTLAEDVIDQMMRPKDLQELSQWLKTTFSKARQFRFCFIAAKILTLISSVVVIVLDRWDLLNPGTLALVSFGWFQGALGWYFLIPGATLTKHLARHDYELFAPDPASSRLVVALSNMIYSALFVAVAIATLFSSGVFLLGQQNPKAQIAFLVLTAWGPILLILLLHQIAAMRIVERAKRRALEPLQSAVHELQARIHALDVGELERLNKLLDLHKRIQGANMLALDWKGMLVVVNTLLLPVASLAVQFLRK